MFCLWRIARTGFLDVVFGGAPTEVAQPEKLVGIFREEGGSRPPHLPSRLTSLLLGVGTRGLIDAGFLLILLVGPSEPALQHSLKGLARRLDT